MSRYAEGQTHQLVDALEANNWSADDLTKLGQAKPEQHKAMRDVLNGRAKIVYPQHLIDCDAKPFMPNGWTVDKHWETGQLEWNPSKIELYLSRNQQSGKVIEGNKLRKELASQQVLNANVLDYLLAHTDLIPEEWKGKYVFFWGTIYRSADDKLCVRCLYWDGGQWYWLCRWLGGGFGGVSPAAVLSK